MVKYQEIMESLLISFNSSYNHTEANEFILREIRIWGEDEIDYLIESGYVPVKLSNGKWSWLFDADRSAHLASTATS
jgi:hypothetical protein